MISSNRKSRLRFRSRIYVGLLVFLSSFSFPVFISCTGTGSRSVDQKDNPELKIRDLEAQLNAKNDSLIAANKELARRDSLNALMKKEKNKADSMKKPSPKKTKYVPSQPAVDYGVYPNYENPGVTKPKN